LDTTDRLDGLGWEAGAQRDYHRVY